MASLSSPDHETDDEFYDDEMIQTSYCGCLWGFYARALPCGRRNGYGARGRHLLQQQGEVVPRESWLLQNVKKAKELSEVLAGPKWKNFIRSIGSVYKKRRVQAMYDPQSYALNFDEGVGREAENPAYFQFPSSGYAATASTLGTNQGKT